jgi:hypothetical protein
VGRELSCYSECLVKYDGINNKTKIVCGELKNYLKVQESSKASN